MKSGKNIIKAESNVKTETRFDRALRVGSFLVALSTRKFTGNITVHFNEGQILGVDENRKHKDLATLPN